MQKYIGLSIVSTCNEKCSDALRACLLRTPTNRSWGQLQLTVSTQAVCWFGSDCHHHPAPHHHQILHFHLLHHHHHHLILPRHHLLRRHHQCQRCPQIHLLLLQIHYLIHLKNMLTFMALQKLDFCLLHKFNQIMRGCS